jgi:hypothetical protein
MGRLLVPALVEAPLFFFFFSDGGDEGAEELMILKRAGNLLVS